MPQTFTDIPLRVNGTQADAGWWNILRSAGLGLETGVLPSGTFSIANNQSSPTNVTPLSFDGTVYTSVRVDVDMYRTDAAPTEKRAWIELYLTYKTTGWSIDQVDHGDDCGVTFSISTTGSTGQVKYVSTNFTGGSYTGAMKYSNNKFG